MVEKLRARRSAWPKFPPLVDKAHQRGLWNPLDVLGWASAVVQAHRRF